MSKQEFYKSITKVLKPFLGGELSQETEEYLFELKEKSYQRYQEMVKSFIEKREVYFLRALQNIGYSIKSFEDLTEEKIKDLVKNPNFLEALENYQSTTLIPHLNFDPNNQINVHLIGAAGYIGIRLAQHLQKNSSICLHLYDKFSDTPRFKLENTKESNYRFQSGSVVIYLGGPSSVKQAEEDLYQTFERGIEQFKEIIQVCEANSCKLIYASSASVYNNHDKFPVAENVNLNSPINNYDMYKQVIDMLATKSKCNCVGLRFGTVCGWSLNQRDDVVYSAMLKSAKTSGLIQVYNPDNWRGILGMNDCIRAIEKLIVSSWEGQLIYNLSSFNRRIIQIAEDIQNETKARLISYGDTDNAYRFQLDASNFKRDFNFEFRDTSESIIKELIKGWDYSIHSTR